MTFRPRFVQAEKYIEPIERGRSRPCVIEADDGRRYVVKYQSTPKFTRRIIAEFLAGNLARAYGFLVPEIVIVDISDDLKLPEMSERHRDNLEASWGLNVGFQYLTRARRYHSSAMPPIGERAVAEIIWFDAIVMNTDRLPRNPNIMIRGNEAWLIDFDSAFNIHHDWAKDASQRRLNYSPVLDPEWPPFNDHGLLPYAGSINDVTDDMRSRVPFKEFEAIVEAVPQPWLDRGFPRGSLTSPRQDYLEFMSLRLTMHAEIAEHAELLRQRGICVQRALRAADREPKMTPFPRGWQRKVVR